jgi:hypothetical protein
MRTHVICMIFFAFALLIGPTASPLFADVIQIHITGLDFTYDGTDIYDSVSKDGGAGDASKADQLTSIVISKNGVLVGSLTASDNIYADVLFDSVLNIPVDGGMVDAGDGSAEFGLDLLQVNGSTTSTLLSLKTNSLKVSYSGYGIYAAVGGAADGLISGDLPFDLDINADDQVTFVLSSSYLTSLVSDSNYVKSFNASGTGDINITQSVPIPEPATMTALISLAIVGFFSCIRRRS